MSKDMDIREFRALLDIHGAQPGRWPRDKAAAMHALCAMDGRARAMLEEARALDALIEDSAPGANPQLKAAILAAATGADNIAAIPAPAQSWRPAPAAPGAANDNAARRWMAGAVLAASLFAGVWIGLSGLAEPVGEALLGGAQVAGVDNDALDDIIGMASAPENGGDLL